MENLEQFNLKSLNDDELLNVDGGASKRVRVYFVDKCGCVIGYKDYIIYY